MPTPKLSDSPQASDSRVRSARKRAGLGWVKGAGLGWVKGAGPGWVKRSLRLGLLLVVTTSLALVLLIAVYIALAWPRMSDQLQLPGLKAPVLIQHDDAGVVHVLADSSRDAWFALGALHARERLWQLEMNRRIAQGRLSELFGASTLPTDRFLRSLDLQPLAKRQLRGASASLQEQLQAYADGVNAWVAQMKVYPPEFLLLKSWSEGPYFEPYRPEDAQAWSLVMALELERTHDLAYRPLAGARTRCDWRGTDWHSCGGSGPKQPGCLGFHQHRAGCSGPDARAASPARPGALSRGHGR
ncbi:MAG: hypothetical protein EBX17_02130 [Betaproteobacteria bacterium]|nr:hypothetical protein [Betaproteobacteria bacterium]